MQPLKGLEYLGTLTFLVKGGNDTTPNSISRGLLVLNENPADCDEM